MASRKIELEVEVASQQTAIKMLRKDVNQSRTIAKGLARLSVTTSRFETIKIPTPERFDATRNKLRPFITQLRLKVSAFKNEQAKLRLAINCLTGEALDQVTPYVKDVRITLKSISDLITLLDNAFGNP